MTQAIPAATVVIFRERQAGAPELLMVERAAAMAFAGGAMVFPGGRIDPEDRALAALHSGDAEDAAARIAAIRETLEESGVPVGFAGTPEPAVLAAVRADLHRGKPFGEALAQVGLVLDLDQLVPFARWLPDHLPSRVFDARFFLARLPEGAPEPQVDGTENSRALWTTAAAMLDAADAGAAQLIFPTRRTLERLARFASFEQAAADASAHPIRTITPWIERRDGIDHLCIPAGLGYPVTAEALSAVERG